MFKRKRTKGQTTIYKYTHKTKDRVTQTPWVLPYTDFLCPRDEELGGMLIYPLFVRPFVRPSGYRYMVCPAISSYSFGATALIFCRMFIHIIEMCMSTAF